MSTKPVSDESSFRAAFPQGVVGTIPESTPEAATVVVLRRDTASAPFTISDRVLRTKDSDALIAARNLARSKPGGETRLALRVSPFLHYWAGPLLDEETHVRFTEADAIGDATIRAVDVLAEVLLPACIGGAGDPIKMAYQYAEAFLAYRRERK